MENYPLHHVPYISWWHHQMETFSVLLAICAENSPVPGEFPAQRPGTLSFDVFFDLRLNKRLSKQSWGWRFETLSRPLWCHRNDIYDLILVITVPADGKAPNGARPSAGTVMTTKFLHCFSGCWFQFTFLDQIKWWNSKCPAWISNHMPSRVWDEITYPFLNFNGCNRWSLGMDK